LDAFELCNKAIGDLFDRFISTDVIGYAVHAVGMDDADAC